MKKFQIDDKKLKEASIKGKETLCSLEKMARDLKCQIFSGHLLKFEEHEDKVQSSLIGAIAFQNIQLFGNQFEKLQ